MSWSPESSMAPCELRLVLHTLVGSWDGRLAAPSGCRTEMSGGLWETLPNEVLDRILMLAPAASIVRFKAVCRSWRTFLSSRQFLCGAAAALNSQSLPHLCFYHIQFVEPADQAPGRITVSRNSTTELDLTFLPREFVDAGQRYLTSNNGLLCLASGHPGLSFPQELAFCVVNPITRQYRMLPQVVLPAGLEPRGRNWVMRLIALPGRGFKVLFLLDRERLCRASTVGIYCSSTGLWSVTLLTWGDEMGYTCLFSDELIYTRQESHMLLYTRTGAMGGFVCQQFPIPRFVMDRDASIIRLVQHLTGLYAVILTRPIPDNILCCCIWKMEDGGWHNVCIRQQKLDRSWVDRERISVIVGNQDNVAINWDAFLVVGDYIFVTLGCQYVLTNAPLSTRMLPRLLGFRIASAAASRLVVLEVDLIVDSTSPINPFVPRLDGL